MSRTFFATAFAGVLFTSPVSAEDLQDRLSQCGEGWTSEEETLTNFKANGFRTVEQSDVAEIEMLADQDLLLSDFEWSEPKDFEANFGTGFPDYATKRYNEGEQVIAAYVNGTPPFEGVHYLVDAQMPDALLVTGFSPDGLSCFYIATYMPPDLSWMGPVSEVSQTAKDFVQFTTHDNSGLFSGPNENFPTRTILVNIDAMKALTERDFHVTFILQLNPS